MRQEQTQQPTVETAHCTPNPRARRAERSRRPIPWGRIGIRAGLFAGLLFLAFQLGLGMPRRPTDQWLLPLERIAAMVLPGSPPTDLALPLVLVLGIAVHLGLAIGFGLVFTLTVSRLVTQWRAVDLLAVLGGVYGLGLWVINYYLIAPRIGWEWFPFQTNLFVQASAHVVAFGCVLGLIVEHQVARYRGPAAYPPEVAWRT
jgi:hypothetical protein